MTRFLSLRYWVLVACVDFNDLRWFERQACIGDSTVKLLLLDILGSGCIMTAAFFSGSARVPRHNRYVYLFSNVVSTDTEASPQQQSLHSKMSRWLPRMFLRASIFVRAGQRLGDG